MRLLAGLALLALTGCAGLMDIVAQRKALYAPEPLYTESPAAGAYAIALANAKKAYANAPPASPSAVAEYVDAGIAQANHSCRAWLNAVSQAQLRFAQGEANLGVLQGLIVGILAASNVHRDVIAAYGLGSAAIAGYEQGFVANVLFMSDWATQTKVREAMAQRAGELRAKPPLTYPAAVDAIEEYAMLCQPQAAKAMASSALTATKTTVTPAGTIQSTPIETVNSGAVKDDSGERIIAYWIPGNVVNPEREARLIDWMREHAINTSIPYFAHAKLYAAARQQAVADLQISPAVLEPAK
jgi:hypothetical protein